MSKAAKGNNPLAQKKLGDWEQRNMLGDVQPILSPVTTDCSSSDGTAFTPKTPAGNPGQYNFIKYCGFDTDGEDVIEALVVDVDTCIALFSNWDYMEKDGPKCALASTVRV
ncbi:hypothetical protein P3342_002627 [Pyrenophora teres f. teres]|uniref:Uncharacterized protein n=1 Tax=Pyrenophora teres f. teres TaxID=97479 RepID=A0A6S6VC63_9PLEO|nr:hypothetical protein HRS9139_01367 [Pyrenophora teres f. teres]KAE8850861.1 hypothetical protein PTNB85_01277 [Pyrenophora teres f. teres]KAE8851107.1 hypothetical protein HRS9122_01394 [Pyrenophora teres f. teres]KAE8869780.1 hypothetical protein PTNB29_00124 [Pyrenophora teres f. teres]KAE8873492.1 hypothetical protein PTNB73_00124 [Pyrenophora teres f. teres]